MGVTQVMCISVVIAIIACYGQSLYGPGKTKTMTYKDTVNYTRCWIKLDLDTSVQ